MPNGNSCELFPFFYLYKSTKLFDLFDLLLFFNLPPTIVASICTVPSNTCGAFSFNISRMRDKLSKPEGK